MKRLLLLPAAALLSLAHCGGGASSSVTGGGSTHTLAYANPSNTAGQFALVLDTTATTSSTLVLDLVGPETYNAATSTPATPAVGVTFGFNVDTTKAAWAATPVINGTLFTNPSPGLQLAQGWVKGGTLQGIVSNKGFANQVNDIGVTQGIIGKLALIPVQGSAADTAVSLADNGLGTVLDSSGTPYPIQVLVGTLTLN